MAKANLFIIGAPKCGTTSLYDILNSQEAIEMSSVKEPHFFSKDLTENTPINIKKRKKIKYKNRKITKRHSSYIESREVYESLWTNSNQAYYGEASPSYLYSNIAAEEIFRYNPNSKIIVILRNPYERLFSHIKADRLRGRYDISLLLKEVQHLNQKIIWDLDPGYIRLSLYSKNLQSFYNIFPSKNILILPFQILKDQGKLQQILTLFLDYPISKTEIIHSNRSDDQVLGLKKYQHELVRFMKNLVIGNSINSLQKKVMDRKLLDSILTKDIKELFLIEEKFLRNVENKYD